MKKQVFFINLKTIQIFLALIIFSAILLFLDFEPENPLITKTFAVAVLMAFLWVTESIPIAITSLLPLVLFPFLGIMNGKDVSSQYFNHTIFLYVGGFIVAFAMEKWNLHKRIALRILMLIGVSPARILLGFMLATGFLSMWMSNTATTMMMIAIVMSIIAKLVETLGEDKVGRYSVGLYLGIAYSASIGGIATLVGTPPNLAFVQIYSILFPEAAEISFAGWFVQTLPLTILIMAGAWALLFFMYKPVEKWKSLDNQTFKNQYKQLGKMSFEEKIVLILFIVLSLLWVFRTGIKFEHFTIPGWSGLFKNSSFFNDGTSAILISILLFMIPSRSKPGEWMMDWKTANRIPWNIVLLFGGGFALAKGFEESGLSLWFGNQLTWISNVPPFFIILIITLMISFLTELTSNIATTQMLLPVFASLAIGINMDPLFLMIPATLAASMAFMLPVATPPNAIVFASNVITIKQMARTGVWLNMLAVLIITIYNYFNPL